MALLNAPAAVDATELMRLPQECIELILEAADYSSLGRIAACCTTLHRLVMSEKLWEAQLAALWKDKYAPSHGLRMWWWCELRDKSGQTIVRAMPSPCADTAVCKTLRECSFRESYEQSLVDSRRRLLSDEELLGHVWTLRQPVDLSASSSSTPRAEESVIFRSDGVYLDTIGLETKWEMQSPANGCMVGNFM